MAKSGKNIPKPQPTSGEPTSEKPRYDAAVKLTAEFKEKLEDVAADLGLFPGALIERQMGDFIHAEWTRVLEEKLRRAKADLK